MLNWIVSSSLLILVVVGLGAALKEKLSARFRYALWAMVALRLLVPATFGESSFSVADYLREVPAVQNAETLRGVENLHYDQDSGMVYTYGGLMYDHPEVLAENATEAEFQRMETVFNLRMILMPLWIGGMVIMGAVFFFTNRRFRRRLEESAAPLEADCDVFVFVTDAVAAPCLFGFPVPSIYVTPEEPASDGTVRLGETKSAVGDSYYTVEAELPLYTGEDVDPSLWKKLEDNWRSWDAMTEMRQMLSSTLPGSCSRECDTWAECQEYLGVDLDNPLEESWTFANESAIPLDTPALKGNGYHAEVRFYGTREGKLESVEVKTGYLDGDVRLAMTVYLCCAEEPLTHRCLWAERVTFETETMTLADGTEALLVTPEDSGNYCSTDAYFVRCGALYKLHAIGEKGAEAQMRTALETALAKFGE